ncbi:hypothetical protein Cpha266_1784 [Chlorobium phaeobacteroides DSM 266]|uniref:Uncharacterized protein n=1 Tax=Chlorobium phaeobacteroides (strain DSM 266 / SMG 266 / 2430) TaxID=290317 RepID=A1BHC4_CHLPD|nr:hypothetical protein Cpha266_1784 [Chlorobium phaeobacteroides DSM 266]
MTRQGNASNSQKEHSAVIDFHRSAPSRYQQQDTASGSGNFSVSAISSSCNHDLPDKSSGCSIIALPIFSHSIVAQNHTPIDAPDPSTPSSKKNLIRRRHAAIIPESLFSP